MIFPWLPQRTADSLAAVRDVSLARLVREHLQAMILRGELSVGQRINEPDIAATFGISRVPVREALRELESSGLVVSRKHAGVFVRQPDAAEIADLYAMRELLDGFAGRQVAALPNAARRRLVAGLGESIAKMRAAVSGPELQRYYVENLHFHWMIIEAAGNGVLAASYRDIVQKLHVSRLKNLSQDIGIQVSIVEHAEIVAAIRAGDVPATESLMARHVGDAYNRLSQASG